MMKKDKAISALLVGGTHDGRRMVLEERLGIIFMMPAPDNMGPMSGFDDLSLRLKPEEYTYMMTIDASPGEDHLLYKHSSLTQHGAWRMLLEGYRR
jgi:hypothetical protein